MKRGLSRDSFVKIFTRSGLIPKNRLRTFSAFSRARGQEQRRRARLKRDGAQKDADQLLIESMLAPPPLEDARNSLEFWQGRRKTLPLYRRAARREAKEMAVSLAGARPRRRAVALRGEPRRPAFRLARDFEHLVPSARNTPGSCLLGRLGTSCFRKVKLVVGSFAADRRPVRARARVLIAQLGLRPPRNFYLALVRTYVRARRRRRSSTPTSTRSSLPSSSGTTPSSAGGRCSSAAGSCSRPSYEAKARGVRDARWASRRALRLCPGAVVVPPAHVGLLRGEQGRLPRLRGHDAAGRGALDRRGVPRRPRDAPARGQPRRDRRAAAARCPRAGRPADHRRHRADEVPGEGRERGRQARRAARRAA